MCKQNLYTNLISGFIIGVIVSCLMFSHNDALCKSVATVMNKASVRIVEHGQFAHEVLCGTVPLMDTQGNTLVRVMWITTFCDKVAYQDTSICLLHVGTIF